MKLFCLLGVLVVDAVRRGIKGMKHKLCSNTMGQTTTKGLKAIPPAAQPRGAAWWNPGAGGILLASSNQSAAPWRDASP